ncbi:MULTISPECIES: DNA polymerase III subunit delta [unclassified Arcicella]|uniref:DNA polymerase III subunit delta n=1 Tax=unclassified Arcicella TaxID=2644986 RepID=UPI0028619408|nr:MULTISPECIES: DNA polymerase III subunit delta [unclassified Arcicella]MDR6561757.1 DNA polymerase-3 subunit delta [Arcicella sp. BE51]MDR6812537.1 DNA polymerase-3 subunit delta [Arcicella sp. BE140]MDR6823691.1 DNA polymerase-3 subunit delta [Arcicella sp. BE139]
MPKSSTEVLKELKKKTYAPLYLLHGDEPYYIDKVADYLEEHALGNGDKSFNQFVLFGKDLNVPSLLSYAKRFPMMSDKQLILVKEAQGIQGLEQKDMQVALEAYAQKPLDSTILILMFKDSVDERKAWIKAFDKNGVVMPSKKLYDNKIPDWILEYCHEQGLKISRKAIEMLIENVGNDLKRLASEINKIVLNLRVDEEINAHVVEKFVGISKEYNYFEFQKALITRDVLKANQIVNFFAANPKDNPLAPIVMMLFNFFSKVLLTHVTPDKSEKGLASVLGVNPFFTKDYSLAIRNYNLSKVVYIISEIKKLDLKSKGIDSGSMTDGEALREITFKILH